MKLQSIGYLVFVTFIMASTAMAAPEPSPEKTQVYTLQYLRHATHGELVHKIPIRASSFNEAIVLSRKQCVSDLMDRQFSNDDILNMCNNPRQL